MLQPRVLDLNEVIGETERMLRRLLGEDVEVAVGLNADLPHVKADPGQVNQVLLNLVVNARDAMPHGGKLTISTTIAERDGGRYASLAVADTGVGIDHEAMEHIFEPFFTTKAPGEGTGLGLATVYGIVNQSGGFVTAESKLGAGTTFTVFLPESAEPLSREQAAHEERPTGVETILLVEDQEVLRRLVGEMLAAQGYEVLTAAGPDDAARVVDESGHCDLLLTDVVLPKSSGVELARDLASRRSGLRTLFMSGFTTHALLNDDIVDAAFLQKPFTAVDLACKVREVLDEPSPRRT